MLGFDLSLNFMEFKNINKRAQSWVGMGEGRSGKGCGGRKINVIYFL